MTEGAKKQFSRIGEMKNADHQQHQHDGEHLGGYSLGEDAANGAGAGAATNDKKGGKKAKK